MTGKELEKLTKNAVRLARIAVIVDPKGSIILENEMVRAQEVVGHVAGALIRAAVTSLDIRHALLQIEEGD